MAVTIFDLVSPSDQDQKQEERGGEKEERGGREREIEGKELSYPWHSKSPWSRRPASFS